MTWVAGADGCRAGWLVVLRALPGGALHHRVVPTARALLMLPEKPAVLGVDLPIGLPARAERGGRACDRAARALLGAPRSSSVFSPPARGALQERHYAAAQAANRASSDAAIGLTKQAFYLFDKMRALDRVLTPVRQAFVREVHPEVSFAALNGGAGLPESKKTNDGRARRRALLEGAGVSPPQASPSGATPDDLLDACAACWTAGRIARGHARALPQGRPPPTDVRGLRMQIWQ